MKRKLTALLLATVTALSSTATIFADGEITVKLNDSDVAFDQAPVVESGRTLVPFRAILESMGVTVDWDGATKTITCTKDDKTVTLTIGASEIDIDGVKTALDVPAKIINGRTLVPLRAVSESFDAEVNWVADTKTIEIKTAVSENATEETSETTTEETTEETSEVASTKSAPLSTYEVKDDDGTVLIEASVYIGENVAKLNSTAQKIVNEYASKLSAEECLKAALENGSSIDDLKEDAKTIKKERGDEFTPYNCSVVVDATANKKFVSVKEFDSIFLGGAHPDTALKTKTFNLKTGVAASLSDVARTIDDRDETDPLGGSEATLLAQLIVANAVVKFSEKIDADPSAYFENAKENLDKLSQDNFYVTEDGIVFFFNAYEIAPYAAGIQEVNALDSNK